MTIQTPTDALRLVPVEPTPKMLKAAFAAMSATPSGEWKRMKAENKTPREIFDAKMRPRWSAMLAAAPASPLPGGGDWSAIRNAFVRHAEAFVKASRYEEASAIADNAAREIQDLTSPLPAAPTGEPK